MREMTSSMLTFSARAYAFGLSGHFIMQCAHCGVSGVHGTRMKELAF
jgi:hypothetical protein